MSCYFFKRITNITIRISFLLHALIAFILRSIVKLSGIALLDGPLGRE